MVVRVRVESVKQRSWVGQTLIWTADSFILAGVCGLVIWAWGLSDGALYQYVQRVQFARMLAGGGAATETQNPVSTPLPRAGVVTAATNVSTSRPLLPALTTFFSRDPQVIGRLEAPGIGLSVMVRDGVDDATLRRAAGHVPSTALPGEAGNFVVLGHRDTFFRALRGVHRGDSFKIRTNTGQFTYVVDSFEVTGPDAISIDQGPTPRATLITCFPFTYIGPAPRRFVVHARLEAARR